MASKDLTKGDVEAAVLFRNFKGINNLSASERLPDNELRDAVNVNIDRDGRLLRRDGYSQIYAGSASVRSLFANGSYLYFAEGTSLKRLTAANTTPETLFDGLDATAEVAMLELNNELYFSDGHTSGIYGSTGVRSWGLDTPDNPSLASTTGTLDAATYGLALTYLNAAGEESGAREGTFITVNGNAGLVLRNIPQPRQSDVTTIRVYLTKPNDAVFYRQADLPVGTTTHTILTSANLGAPLETQFMQRFPACTQLAAVDGFIYGASGSVLYKTQPLRYGLYRPDSDLYPFATDITVLGGISDALHSTSGLWVVADKTYFLGSSDERLQNVKPYTAPQQRPVVIPGEYVKLPQANQVLVWMANAGFVVATAGGELSNLTQSNVSLPQYDRSAIVFRQENGLQQIVTTSKSTGGANAAAMKDEWTATVVRNGLTI